MLTKLRIANFKSFGIEQEIPIRPLTLVFGPNGAGKSAIIQALALLHHAVSTSRLDVHRTILGEEAIDLGGFRQ